MRLAAGILALALAVPAVAVLDPGIQWEVRTTGATTNGCGWLPGSPGPDRTQQDAPAYAVSDAVTDGTTTITSATANFDTDVKGHVVYVAGGSGSIVADRYQIIDRNSTTSITLDRSTGLTAGTGVTLIIGGGCSTFAQVAGDVVAGNTVHVRAGTYAEELVNAVAGSAGYPITWEGYAVTHGDAPVAGARPLIDGGGVRAACVSGTGAAADLRYIDCTGATSHGIFLNSPNSVRIRGVRSYGNGGAGIRLGTANRHCIDCEADGNAGDGLLAEGGIVLGGVFHGNGGNGVNSGHVFGALAYDNNGCGFADCTAVIASTAAYNGTDGVCSTTVATGSLVIRGSILAFNTGYGARRTGDTVRPIDLDFSAYHANVAGTVLLFAPGANNSTADPQFVDAAGGDYGIGANLKGLGWPRAIPGASTGYPDPGAVQRQETGGVASGGVSAARVVNR